jgi:hypothetical protein
MISDVLFDAVDRLDHYLNEPTFHVCYAPDSEIRKEIVALRDKMNQLREKLDTPSQPVRKTATCHQCGATIYLVPRKRSGQWQTNPKKPDSSWHCGNDPMRPVLAHAPHWENPEWKNPETLSGRQK